MASFGLIGTPQYKGLGLTPQYRKEKRRLLIELGFQNGLFPHSRKQEQEQRTRWNKAHPESNKRAVRKYQAKIKAETGISNASAAMHYRKVMGRSKPKT